MGLNICKKKEKEKMINFIIENWIPVLIVASFTNVMLTILFDKVYKVFTK